MNTYNNELKLHRIGSEGDLLAMRHIPDGFGDPFVLRFNGHYYLYPSSPAGEVGVRVWTSDDLVHWKYGGQVAQDACLKNCYAPEVFFFNGLFYLVTSANGTGHYVYTSDSPLGPFSKLQDNQGLTIDGSMFADDDAQLFFYHAEYPCIYGHRMHPDGMIEEGGPVEGTSMGHWTEGPGVFKRSGKYYITMTGNHLLSRAYRIDYAISDVSPLGPYRVPEQKTLLVNTDYAHGSLGHSSNVIGPDLDSYWICYHNYEIDIQGRHTRRNANLDRMLFNNEKLMVSGPTRHVVEAPHLPDFFGWADDSAFERAFVRWGDGVQLNGTLGESFTAEVCLVPGERAEVCLGYADEDNTAGVELTGSAIALYRIENGRKTILAQKALFDGFNACAMHTLRLECRRGRINVLVDTMTQFADADVGAQCGRLGARGAARVSYMAFTRHVGQRSDFEHYHAVPGAIDAAMFASAECARVSGGHSEAECGFRPEDGMRLTDGFDGGQDLILGQGEYVAYRINAAFSGRHHLFAVLEACEDSVLEIAYPQETFSVSLPTGEMHSVELGELAMRNGFQSFEAHCLSGKLRIRKFEIFPVANSIRGEWSGLKLCAAAKQLEGLASDGFIERFEGLQMDREVQAMGIFGERFLVDQQIEADFRFRGEGTAQSAGLFLRLSENSQHTEQVTVGHRGYYVGFDMETVRVDRMNFMANTLASAPCRLEKDKLYTLRAEIHGETISVYLDGELLLTVIDRDPLLYGQVAAGSFGARVTVERVKIDAK